MQKYREIIGWINYILFLCVAATLAAPAPIMRWTWTVWLISWILELRFLNRKNLQYKPQALPAILIATYFLWQCITTIWTIDPSASIDSITRQIPFLVLPLITLYGLNQHYNTKQIAITLIIGTFITTIAYNIHIFTTPRFIQYHHIFFRHIAWIYTAQFLLIKHRFLYAIPIILAAILLLLHLPKPTQQKHNKTLYIILSITYILITYATIYLTESRASILISLALLLIYLPTHFLHQHKWHLASITILIIIALAITYKHYTPRMQQINLNNIHNNNLTLTQKGGELRYAIWTTAIQHAKEYILIGKGTGTSTTYLRTKYIEDGIGKTFYREPSHAHQQYIESLINSGIIGLLLLLATLISTIITAQPKQRTLTTIITLLFALAFLFDSLFHPSEGIIIYSFATILIYLLNTPTSNLLSPNHL